MWSSVIARESLWVGNIEIQPLSVSKWLNVSWFLFVTILLLHEFDVYEIGKLKMGQKTFRELESGAKECRCRKDMRWNNEAVECQVHCWCFCHYYHHIIFCHFLSSYYILPLLSSYYILPALPRCELHQFQLLGRPVNKCGQRCLALHFCNTRVGS